MSTSVDLFPTLLELFGIQDAPEHVGRSLFDNTPTTALFPTSYLMQESDSGEPVGLECTGTCRDFLDHTHQTMLWSMPN